MASLFTIYIGNNNLIQAEGITDPETMEYVSNALLSFSIIDKLTNEPIVSNVVMNYVTGSDGDYIGSTPSNMAIVKGQRLILQVVATLIDNSRGQWDIECIAAYRRPSQFQ